jgi:Arc/MetJ-type ribon-helix-helix transcriptional regulator
MEKQNVTLSLPKELLKKAKMMAASRHKSLSEFLRESLEERIRESSGYRTAKSRQLRLLKEGFDLGTKGRIGFTRDELHERQ